MDRQTEEEHLRKADADISQGRDRIARQTLLIERLADHGHDVRTAEDLLQTMRGTLAAMEEHRRLILKALAADTKPA